MPIHGKTSTFRVHHFFDPLIMSAAAEAVVKVGAKVLGHIAEEAVGSLDSHLAKTATEKARSHFTNHSERLAAFLAESNVRA
jgi:hypothetical protein